MSDPISYIHALGRFSGAPGTHRIRALLAALGNPQDKLRFVHLAGTNGKGSTATMTAQILQEAGYCVGLSTSPYLVRFHERIRVNGAEITDADLARLTEQVACAQRTLTLPTGETIGEFEFVVALSMLSFVEQKCDIVVLETGLGGAFDATNVIAPPIVAALTSISLDHTAVLGNTVAEIAKTKAGIIKADSVVVCAAGQPPEAYAAICAACDAVGAPLRTADAADVLQVGLSGSRFCYQGREYRLSLVGLHQLQNACTALEISFALQKYGIRISEEAIVRGLAKAQIMGRLERVSEAPLTLLDGAHNHDGAAALRRALEMCLAGRRLLLVLGMVEDKAVEQCVAELAQCAAQVFVCAPNNARALASERLAEIVRCTGAAVTDCETLANALVAANRAAQPRDCILVAGSLYLVGEAEKIFAARQKSSE